jgi:hypothetical protein
MKYIKNRINFKNSNIKSVNEVFENDTKWGDTLLGRLINSSIRTSKIKFNATKISSLLSDFKSQLDIIISESLSRDTRNEFNILQMKSFLVEIESVCISTKTEEEKLEDLIGTSNSDVWDPENPNDGSWSNNLDDGLIIKTHDFIEKNIKKDVLSTAGIPKENILNAISDLIDNLRKYSYELGNPNTTTNSATTSFPIRFGNLIKKYNGVLTEKYLNKFSLKKYNEYILEDNQKLEILDKEIVDKIKSINFKNEKEIEEVIKDIDKKTRIEILNKIISNSNIDKDKKEAEDLLKLINSVNESLIKENTNSNNIKDIWYNWLDNTKIGQNGLSKISQQEIDKLEKMLNGQLTGKLALDFDIKKTPDPIINIVRIFKRAHDLYYTDVIPSGRSKGAVSNSVYREYEKLGSENGRSTQEEPGYGPWAVKNIRNKWVDGVMQILEDQKYRKVLANINFVVAGSEDTFNLESLYNNDNNKINEEVGEVGDDKKTHSKILFDFIIDLLDKETAANFDKQRTLLMKKYFGNFEMPDKKEVTPAPVSKPKDPIEEKTIFWKNLSNRNIDLNGLGKIPKLGPFLMIPIKDSKGKEKIIKLQIISEVNIDLGTKNIKCYVVRFCFGGDLFLKDLIKGKYKDFKISNDDKVGDDDIFYGLMDDSFFKNLDKINFVYKEQQNIVAEKFDLVNFNRTSFGDKVSSILYKKDKNEEQINEENIGNPIDNKDILLLTAEIKKII